MHFPTLMAECDPSAELEKEVSDLMDRKAATRELGAFPLSPVVTSFLDSEFELARESFEGGLARSPDEVIARAKHFYRMVVERLEGEADGMEAAREC